MARVAELSEDEIQRLILDMPFRKLAQRGFLDYGRALSRVQFVPALWSRARGISAGEISKLSQSSRQSSRRSSQSSPGARAC
jgi:hypothetical protein